MSLYERQYRELLTRALLKVMVQGRLPDIDTISKQLADALKKSGKTIFRFIPQAKKKTFKNELVNRQLDAIEFDTRILHEEILDLMNQSALRLSYADLYYRTHSHYLTRLEATLNAILFTFDQADFYFLHAFDSFTDYSNTNVEASTADIIDLSEKAIVLPYGGKNTKRINSSHMYNMKSWPVTVVKPSDGEIVRKAQVTEASFGNIFSDIMSGWLYEVVTETQNGAAISVTFPIAGRASDEVEVLVNRFELVPYSTTSQKAIVEISTDDVNYKTLEGYEDGLLLQDQKLTYGMDFETELVQFVRITISKSTHDEEIAVKDGSKQYVYRFGLKGFTAFATGRKAKARYQSKPFDFSGEEEKISRVSLKADVSTPKGTDVDFSVALANVAGEPITSFIPIKPVNADGKVGSTETVVFGTTEPHEKRFEARPGEFALREVFRGHKFYKYVRGILPNAVFGTAQLIRGHKVWYRDSSAAVSRSEVRDNYITFAKLDTEKMYTTTTEIPLYQNDTRNNQKIVTMTVSNDVYYIPTAHNLIPNFNQQKVGSDVTPTYAVYRVEHLAATPKTSVSFLADRNKVQLPIDNFVVSGADSPTLTNSSGSVAYTEGRDYLIETTSQGGVPRSTGFLIIVPVAQGGNIDTSQKPTLVMHYTINPDITYKVSSVSGKTITLEDMALPRGDTLKVTYRYVPLSPNSIIKASIRVKDSISNSPNVKFFTEGIDYVLNAATGSIQRLPNGAIPDKGSVFVDFLFNNADEDIETFLTWCYVSQTSGVQIKLDLDPTTRANVLSPDSTVGEQFLVNTPQGLIDLTRATRTPVLGPGWVQFIVRSKNPDANQKNDGKGNLVDQVIQLRDVNKKRVFKENGSYFREILALRDPLAQRTMNQLRVNTLPSDHTVFAIDETKPDEPLVVLNFNPGSTNELYLKIPRDESDTDPHPLSYYEVLTLRWESKVASGVGGASVIVRCDLSRDPNVDGGLSPKVFEYFLRASGL